MFWFEIDRCCGRNWLNGNQAFKRPPYRNPTQVNNLKVLMKRNFLFFHIQEHKILEKLPFTDP